VGTTPLIATSRGGNSAKAIRSCAINSEGRVRISFGSAQKYVALLDSGADDNITPRSLLQELDTARLFIARHTLAKPFSVELTVKGPGMFTVVKEQAQLTVELHLSSGPLRLRNVKWLVAENGMDEVLLGRPLLKALGLDAPSHLEAVRENCQDLDCSKIATVNGTGRLSRVLTSREYRVLAERETSFPEGGVAFSKEGYSRQESAIKPRNWRIRCGTFEKIFRVRA
jgi:hypothetical protein